ncbi:Choline binding protein A [Furfurilactobacillus rossiae]|uniref:N-acetylmuramoyl-L-alanine amidase family protein n=1 Tax=Furfurilactobacillus rossiae TaxID=231049 RepID=UPI0015BBDDCC|nr:N-acetylmuramoyl-L-alanine amidase family protein [Furfurilactobacillus rossiae]MCF6166889.1 hypothetical protein [Furfurilactobacillus rossiae]QLE63768.1 Choline binding protein A [Furfurilactobacillus rossiae]
MHKLVRQGLITLIVGAGLITGVGINNAHADSWWGYSSGWYLWSDSGNYWKSGWQWVNNNWYYLNSYGTMQTGWQDINGSWYYFDGSGSMLTGWQWINGAWYYFDGSGHMQTGWQWINGKWYYFQGSGAMQTGWLQTNTWYYLNADGSLRTGWVLSYGKWYYMDNSGAMAYGWRYLDNSWYLLSHYTGVMQTGVSTDSNGRDYYFDNSGKMVDGNFQDAFAGQLTQWFNQINQLRQSQRTPVGSSDNRDNGNVLPALRRTTEMDQWAQARANELASSNQGLSHSDNLYGAPSWAKTNAAGLFNSPNYDYGTIVNGPECLASWWGGTENPVDMWTAEQSYGGGHYLTEVSPYANVGGIGISMSSNGTFYAVFEIGYQQ